MESSQVLLFTTALLLSSWDSATALGLPPATLFGTGQQICNYQYAIPNGGNCVTYGPALEQKLSAVQQDIDRLKLQYVSQNTLLQEELRKIREQASTTDANVADVTKEMKNLQSAIVALQTTVAKNSGCNNCGNSGGVGPSTANAMLQQLVTTTRTQLTQDMLKLENKINTAFSIVQADRQRDGVQQSRVDQAFQAQLRQQQQDLTTVFQKLQQLETRVNNLQQVTPSPQHPTAPAVTPAPTTPTTTTTSTTVKTKPPTTAPPTLPPVTTIPGSTTPNALLQQLQTNLQQLDGRVKTLESNYTMDIPDIKNSLQHMQELSKNESLQLSDVKLEVETVYNVELPDMNKRVQDNYNALSQMSSTLRRDLGPLKTQVQKIAANVTSLTGQMTSLGTRELNQQVKQGQDEQKLSDLSLQVRLLATKLNNLQHAAGITTVKPTPPLTTTAAFIVPTPRPHGSSGQPPRKPSTAQPFFVPTPRAG